MTGTGFVWQNPVLRGTAPDPSVVRVGGEYVVAVSTFDHLPGIRLYRSTDLVHWTDLGGAVTRPAQYRRDGRPGPLSLFAPTLRHRDGRWYLVCTNVTEGQGNFLLHADDPEGPWSDAIWLDREAFDPSLFFDDDGTCYYTRRSLDLSTPGGDLGPIVQTVLDPDTGRLGEIRAITPGPRGYCSNDIEGPHLYRRGDWVYLFAAEGGTWQGHMQTVARSRSPWGPFEGAPHNPVLTHRHRVMHPIQSLGHAELVDDPHGGWWALMLGTRHRGRHHLLGRETFLAPVMWEDGWPVIGDGGTVELEGRTQRSPATGAAARPGPGGVWAAGWRSLGPMPAAALDGADVEVPLGPPLGTDIRRPAGALLRPQSAPRQSFSTRAPQPRDGAAVGIAAVADPAHLYALRLSVGPSGRCATFTRRVDDLETEERIALPLGLRPTLRIDADPARYAFSILDENGAVLWQGQGSARLLSAETCEWFTGVHFALLAEGAPGAGVRFEGVRQKDGAEDG
ncbi:glycoside hydrolase family 43 protein [Rhodobacteraceae bacterium CCMM004]|nr:glycoside hydrolase family 43 protein [Rhodobacteraceae bacterium CCMM004]